MQVAFILALVAAATAAPTSHIQQVTNNVIEPQFPQGFVASGVVPTTYSASGVVPTTYSASGVVPTTYAAGIGAGNFEGTFFGGRPGTYVRQDNAIAAPHAVSTYSALPQTFSAFPQTYSALPQTLSAFPQTYSALPHTYSGFSQTYSAIPQGFSGLPAAAYYSAGPAAVAYNHAIFPKSVQQNEGGRLIEF